MLNIWGPVRRNFTVPLKPFSVNAMYYGRSNGKTQACRDWEDLFAFELTQPGPRQAMSDLRSAFDPAKHCYRMRLLWYSPRATLLTKDGALSSRAFDVTNVEKNLVDMIFLPKYFVQGVPNLNVDDKMLMTLSSGKRLSPRAAFHIEVVLWLEDLQKYLPS